MSKKHAIFISFLLYLFSTCPVFSMAVDFFNEERIQEAKKSPRSFVLIRESEKAHKKRVYIRFMRSKKDIDKFRNYKNYRLFSLEEMYEKLDSDESKFDTKYKLILKNIDENERVNMQTCLSRINPYAIEYKSKIENDPVAIFIANQKMLYDMQMDILAREEMEDKFNGIPLATNNKTSLDNPCDIIEDEELAYRLQLQECSVLAPDHLSFGETQWDSDEAYAAQLQAHFNRLDLWREE